MKMWLHNELKHKDGRRGLVVQEWVGNDGVHLLVRTADKSEEHLVLRTNEPCEGTAGWSWFAGRKNGHYQLNKWIAFPLC
jgi:hypothetical protein